jgi:Protein of unknown function (DUF3606)
MQPSAACRVFDKGNWRKATMTDDLKNRGPQDRARINTAEDHEVQYWTKELGVSAVDLKRLVQMHGNSAEKIRQVIGKKG